MYDGYLRCLASKAEVNSDSVGCKYTCKKCFYVGQVIVSDFLDICLTFAKRLDGKLAHDVPRISPLHSLVISILLSE